MSQTHSNIVGSFNVRFLLAFDFAKTWLIKDKFKSVGKTTFQIQPRMSFFN